MQQHNVSDPHAPGTATVKRYAPPNQRNLGLIPRNSPDPSEKPNHLHPNDVYNNLGNAFPSLPFAHHKSVTHRFYPRLIALSGCGSSEASHLLHDRWKAAVDCYNDPAIDLSERPVMYTGSGASAWGNFRLPHQLMSCPQTDFLVKLEHAIHTSDTHITK